MENASLLLTAYYFGRREWLDKFKVGGGYLSKEDANVINSWFDLAFAIIRNDSGMTYEAFCNLTNYVDCSKLPRQFIQP
jgi:YHS domain-containing protein